MLPSRLRFSLVLAGALASPGFGEAGPPAAPTAGEFQQKLRPVLEEHCFKCHNAEKHKGGIDLTQFDSEGAVLKKFKLWRRVIEQVATEQMPPDDDKFTPMHGEVVVGGVKKILALLDSGHPALLDPGPSRGAAAEPHRVCECHPRSHRADAGPGARGVSRGLDREQLRKRGAGAERLAVAAGEVFRRGGAGAGRSLRQGPSRSTTS